jgi:ER lumen protein retaining receptor
MCIITINLYKVNIFIINNSRKLGAIEIEVSRYLACMAFSRVVRLGFWVIQWINGSQFIYLILADVIHTIVVGDFMFLWFKEKRTDGTILI